MYDADVSHQVLCPELYRALRFHCPGGVKIASQGEPFRGNFSNTRNRMDVLTAGEYYCVNCVFCHDTKHRLWVNHRFGQLDASGRPMFFLAICYNENCMSKPGNTQKFTDTLFSFKNRSERNYRPFALNQAMPVYADDTRGGYQPPGEVYPLADLARTMPNHPAVLYMCQERRYTSAMLQKYEIGYCVRAAAEYRAAQDRIIFPIRMHGDLVGWQARLVGSSGLRGLKYYGMRNMRKRTFLYNYDHAKTCPYVVLVEGVTDCHVLGDASVALLGKTLSDAQLQMMNAWLGKPIIVLLDPEAQAEGTKICQQLAEVYHTVVAVSLPLGYDCGDYDHTTIWNIIRAQAARAGILLPQ